MIGHSRIGEKPVEQSPSDTTRTADESDLEDASTIDDKALMRKIDFRLLPGVTLLYLMSFLDRSNVANARIEGLTEDTNMSGNAYLTGLTLFFIGLVFVACLVLLKRELSSLEQIRPLRDPLQYHPQADNAKVLAADPYYRFRDSRDAARDRSKHGWLLRRTLFPGCGRMRDLSWSRLLLLIGKCQRENREAHVRRD